MTDYFSQGACVLMTGQGYNNLYKMLDKNSKIYVAGHNGLVGSAIWNNLMGRGYTNLVGSKHSCVSQKKILNDIIN